MMQLVEEVTAG